MFARQPPSYEGMRFAFAVVLLSGCSFAVAAVRPRGRCDLWPVYVDVALAGAAGLLAFHGATSSRVENEFGPAEAIGGAGAAILEVVAASYGGARHDACRR